MILFGSYHACVFVYCCAFATYLFQSWASQVQPLEEEVVQLKQELQKSEVDRKQLSAELRECHKMESRVSSSEECEYTLFHVIYTVIMQTNFAYFNSCTVCFCTHGISHIIGLCLLLNYCLFQVYLKEPLGPMKQRLQEEEEGEDPAHRKVKTEVAETVEVKLEGHTQVCRSTCSFDCLVVVECMVCSFGWVVLVFIFPLHCLSTGGEGRRGGVV